MRQYIKNSVMIQFLLMFLLMDILAMGIVHAETRQNNLVPYWTSKAAPIKIVGRSADGKYPIYAIEGEATDITYKANNKLYTSGQLVEKLVFVSPVDAKSPRYNCEFLCKDQNNNTVGLNPNFKFLLKQ